METEKLENGGNWRRSSGRRSLALVFLLLSERLNDYHAVINVVFFAKITRYLHCASLSIEFLTLIVAVLLNSPFNYLSQMCATRALFKFMLRARSLNFRGLLLVVTPSVTSKSTGR